MEMLTGLVSSIDWRGILVAALIFIPFERFYALHDDQPTLRRNWLNDVVFLIFNGIPVKLGIAAVLGVLVAAGRSVMPAGLELQVAALPYVVQVVLVIVLADAGFYFAHRAFHRIPALWRFHAVHHSIEEMDWLAAHRVHPVDQIATMAASLVPAYVLGFDLAAIATYGVIYHWHALLLHSNTRVGFGWLNAIIASPHFHHWHHANERAAWDKNFGAQLTLLDRLFGTYHMPEASPGTYGCDLKVPQNYVAQLVFPVLREVPDGPEGAQAPAAGMPSPEAPPAR